MSTQKALPDLLRPYLALPPELSTVLLTGVLGASTNWLVERYLVTALADHGRSGATASEVEEPGNGKLGDVGVVLVSWMRNFEGWRSEVRRASGLDLMKLSRQHRFTFVDGLTCEATSRASGTHSIESATTRNPPRTASVRASQSTQAASEDTNTFNLPSNQASDLQHTTSAAISAMKAAMGPGARVLLILDQPDVALATSPPPQQPQASLSTSLLSTITALSRTVHATVISVGADAPLIAPAAAAAAEHARGEEGSTPFAFTALEVEHAAFVAGLAHRAWWVVQLRKLETGWASDVSGVVRISRGGGWDGDECEEGGGAVGGEEFLYHVKGDGGVKVFERGAGGVG